MIGLLLGDSGGLPLNWGWAIFSTFWMMVIVGAVWLGSSIWDGLTGGKKKGGPQ